MPQGRRHMRNLNNGLDEQTTQKHAHKDRQQADGGPGVGGGPGFRLLRGTTS